MVIKFLCAGDRFMRTDQRIIMIKGEFNVLSINAENHILLIGAFTKNRKISNN
jgi:hypothetical protein